MGNNLQCVRCLSNGTVTEGTVGELFDNTSYSYRTGMEGRGGHKQTFFLKGEKLFYTGVLFSRRPIFYIDINFAFFVSWGRGNEETLSEIVTHRRYTSVRLANHS